MKNLFISAPVWTRLVGALLCSSLMACGGSGGASSEAPPPTPPAAAIETTSLTIGVTDAEGDFLQYEVALESLELVNAAGDQISVLPASARIDFAQYTDVTEILSVASVPVGVYTHALANLDFSAANIVTQDAEGNVLPAVAIDTQGDPLTQVSVEISLSTFGEDQGFRLRPGTPARFTLDFDLDASNTVTIDDAGTPDDISDDSATTEVSAVWVAEPLLDTEREHRIRGLLQSVDSDAPSVTLAIRPFHLRAGAFGEIALRLSADAVYEIDQQSYTATEGVAALAALDVDTPVVTSGHFVESDERFVVDTVFAGSSVPWAGGEFIKGVVTARDGNQVTVQGVRFTPEDAGIEVSPQLQFSLSADTHISYAGQPNALSDTSVSIGQRVRVYDAEAGGDVDADHVSLLKNQLRSRVVSVASGVIVSELSLFNGRRPAAYEWTQAGADPMAYRVFDNALPHTLEAGDYLKARGWVSAYDFSVGAAINPWDFSATTLIDLNMAVRAAGLHLRWDATPTVPVSVDSQSIVMNLVDVDRALLSVAGFRDNLSEFEQVTIAPTSDGKTVYTLAVKGETGIHIFFNFANLAAELTEQLDAGYAIVGVSGGGHWQADAATFNSHRLVIVVEEVAL